MKLSKAFATALKTFGDNLDRSPEFAQAVKDNLDDLQTVSSITVDAAISTDRTPRLALFLVGVQLGRELERVLTSEGKV